jgi:putative peptidoglycan lipid II flippase
MTIANQTSESRTRQIAKSTLLVMVAFGAAKAISLAQTVIIARVFGVGPEWDAFVTANRIPEQIFNLIAGGALAFAFIPIFSGFLAKDDREGAWRLASHVVNVFFLLTFIASLIAFITAPWLVANVVAPGFSPAEQEQTVGLMRVLLLTTLIFAVSGKVMGILQSHQRFLMPALAPIMFDLGILFGVIFLVQPFGVYGIAYGAVIGSAMHLGIQVPGLIRVRARWWPELGLNDPDLRRVIKLMLPRVADLGVVSINTIITTNIASRLGTGSVSALDWGWRLMQIPETLIGTAMGTVIFPTLAALSEVGDEKGKREAMSGALRFILITTIPSAIGLIFIGRPLISLLERGAFDASASALVYSTLRFFALGLVVHSVLEVLARSFYADKDTLTPLWSAVGGAIVNLVLSYTLTDVARVEGKALLNLTASQYPFLGFTPDVGNVGGLALANTMGVAFEVVVLFWVLRRRWHGANENVLVRAILKTTAASLAMALAIVIVDMIWQNLGLSERGLTFTVAHIIFQTIAGGGVFLAVAFLLKMEELGTLVQLVTRRPKLAEAVA